MNEATAVINPDSTDEQKHLCANHFRHFLNYYKAEDTCPDYARIVPVTVQKSTSATTKQA